MRLRIKLFLLFVTLQCAYGQSIDNNKPNQFFDPQKDRNHWGINTQFAFDRLFGLRETPIELIYKRQKTGNKATRLGLQLLFNYDNESPFPTAPNWDVIETDLILGAFWGKERQHFIGNSPRWQWYYGADINFIFVYNRLYRDEFSGQQHLREYTDERGYRYSTSLKPFLGTRFEITPIIYISVDLIASAQFEIQRVWVEEKSVPNVFPEYHRWNDYNYYWRLMFHPVTRLSIFVKL
jgi:hypothetical protein